MIFSAEFGFRCQGNVLIIGTLDFGFDTGA